jgi:hypothetical protein
MREVDMLKRLLVVCSLVLFILLPVASCSIANDSAITLVPASANTVVQIQIGQILSNPALKKTYDELAKIKPLWPQSADEVLNQMLQNTGVDPYTITTTILFAAIDSANKTQNTYHGIIASGSFDESSLIAKIEEQTHQVMTNSEYKGFKIYSSKEHGKSELAFIGEDQIVIGASKAVRDTIDIVKGDQEPLTGNIITALKRVGTAQITGVFVPLKNLPHQVGESGSQQPPFSLEAFQDIDMVAFSIDLQVLNLSSRIDVHFSDDAKVPDAKDAIIDMISIAKATTQEETIKTSLSNIKVSTADSWVSVRGMTSLPDLSTLTDHIPPSK